MLAKEGAPGRILEEFAHARVPARRRTGAVVVVEVRIDFGVFFGALDDAFDLVGIVGVVNAGSIDNGEVAMCVRVVAHESALRRDNMEPLGKEEVDLVDVFLERGVAGGIVLNVVGGAQALTGVEGDVGGFAIGLAAGGPSDAGRVNIRQRFVVVPGYVECEQWELLKSKNVKDEAVQDEGKDHRGNVKNTAKALPSLALGIEKYLTVGHAGCG